MKDWIPLGAIGLTGILVAVSCTSLREHPVFDPNAKKAEAPRPFTEAWIEFPGPQDRWAGPQSFSLHAKATTPPEITITPLASIDPPAVPVAPPHSPPVVSPLAYVKQSGERVPAGAQAVGALEIGSGKAGPPVTPQASVHPGTRPIAVSTDLVRDRIARLAAWTEGSVTISQTGSTAHVNAADAAPFRDCLTPIVIRLVRADGTMSERRGCRAQSSWSGEVSATVSELESYATGEIPIVRPVAEVQVAHEPPGAVLVSPPAVVRAPAAAPQNSH